MILLRKGETVDVEVEFTDLNTAVLDVSAATAEYQLDDGAWTALTMDDAVHGLGHFPYTATDEGTFTFSYRLTWPSSKVEVLPGGGSDTIRVIA